MTIPIKKQFKPTLFMSVSTGWAVRNFFQTGIVEKLKNEFKIVIFTLSHIKENLLKQGYGNDITFIILDDLKEPLMWRLFRQLKKKIYMESRKSSTEDIWAKYVKRPFYQKIGGKIIRSLLNVIDPIKLLNFIEWVDLKINRSKSLTSIFVLHKPAIFFATHASSYFEELLFRTSLAHNIPTVFMVLSWDHISSKIVLSKKYHSVFVWNTLTKSEILRTYPSYGDNQIKVVGIPQCDIYNDKPQISYKEWCESYGLNPDKKTILFSTMPQVRHNEQHIIIENLLRTIVDGEKLPKDLQILIRCHPLDNTNKYDLLLKNYPVAINKSTLPIGMPQDKWLPSRNEMTTARDCLYFCSIDINIFSTVTLEAAYFNKPIIHIAFDPSPVNNRIPCREYYNFDHFKNITNMEASKMVYSFKDLYEAINYYLENPVINTLERKLLVDSYFSVEIGKASDNAVNELINLKKNNQFIVSS